MLDKISSKYFHVIFSINLMRWYVNMIQFKRMRRIIHTEMRKYFIINSSSIEHLGVFFKEHWCYAVVNNRSCNMTSSAAIIEVDMLHFTCHLCELLSCLSVSFIYCFGFFHFMVNFPFLKLQNFSHLDM